VADIVLSEKTPGAGAAAPDGPPIRQLPLSPRETEVLRLLASGCSTKEMAVALALKLKSVAHLLSRIYGKLGVSDRTAAVMTAWESGFLGPADPGVPVLEAPTAP
jgi:DNA-binding NarL/FixJ family response regulator